MRSAVMTSFTVCFVVYLNVYLSHGQPGFPPIPKGIIPIGSILLPNGRPGILVGKPGVRPHNLPPPKFPIFPGVVGPPPPPVVPVIPVLPVIPSEPLTTPRPIGPVIPPGFPMEPAHEGGVVHTDVADVIRRCTEEIEEEENTMRRRLEQGADKQPVAFLTADPILFSESPLDASQLSIQSRKINCIGRILRTESSEFTVKEFLKEPEAVQQGITCPYKQPTCDAAVKYRTLDGSCNNLRNPKLGMAFTPFLRELPAQYDTDSVTNRDDLPRETGRDNVKLPGSRKISVTIHQEPESKNVDSIWTMEFSLWGQMLAHDVTDRAPGKGFNGSLPNCCNQTIPTPGLFCYNVDIVEASDFFKARFQRDCLGFSRSLEVTDINCEQGRRQQLNLASSFVDGGPIYGVQKEKTRQLRLGSGGLMVLSEPDELPIMPHPNFRATLHGFSYFAAGDDRVNEHAGLIAIETVWVREHNRIAKQLALVNPTWSDEILFQETRRIIIAMLQHITYDDFIIGVVGDDNMVQFGLKPLKDGYFTGYREDTDPSLSNGFAASAFRYGHSMIRNLFSKRNRNYDLNESPALPLKDAFFRSTQFLRSEDPLMRGFVADRSHKCDRIMSDSLVNHLFQTKAGNGGDLAAFNVLRNRDHGMPMYKDWRRMTGLSQPTVFDTSSAGFPNHTAETVNLFRQVYRTPDDVELWTAGLAEIPLSRNAAVGPLFARMVARQFQTLKRGDRFFYETNDPVLRFTPAQLNEIRKVTFAKVLCNTMKFDTIQPHVFLTETLTDNGRKPCADFADLDLNQWRGNPL